MSEATEATTAQAAPSPTHSAADFPLTIVDGTLRVTAPLEPGVTFEAPAQFDVFRQLTNASDIAEQTPVQVVTDATGLETGAVKPAATTPLGQVACGACLGCPFLQNCIKPQALEFKQQASQEVYADDIDKAKRWGVEAKKIEFVPKTSYLEELLDETTELVVATAEPHVRPTASPVDRPSARSDGSRQVQPPRAPEIVQPPLEQPVERSLGHGEAAQQSESPLPELPQLPPLEQSRVYSQPAERTPQTTPQPKVAVATQAATIALEPSAPPVIPPGGINSEGQVHRVIEQAEIRQWSEGTGRIKEAEPVALLIRERGRSDSVSPPRLVATGDLVVHAEPPTFRLPEPILSPEERLPIEPTSFRQETATEATITNIDRLTREAQRLCDDAAPEEVASERAVFELAAPPRLSDPLPSPIVSLEPQPTEEISTNTVFEISPVLAPSYDMSPFRVASANEPVALTFGSEAEQLVVAQVLAPTHEAQQVMCDDAPGQPHRAIIDGVEELERVVNIAQQQLSAVAADLEATAIYQLPQAPGETTQDEVEQLPSLVPSNPRSCFSELVIGWVMQTQPASYLPEPVTTVTTDGAAAIELTEDPHYAQDKQLATWVVGAIALWMTLRQRFAILNV